MADAALLAIRWTHAIAAVAWVGGGIFYWFVLRPAIRRGALSPEAARFAGVEFGKIVMLAMWTLVVTGGALFFARLSEPTSTVPYGVVLAVKVSLSVWMFFLARDRRVRPPASDAPRWAHTRARGRVGTRQHDCYPWCHHLPALRRAAAVGGAGIGELSMNPDLVAILCCPVDRGALTLSVERTDGDDVADGSLTCGECGAVYHIRDSIADLLPPGYGA